MTTGAKKRTSGYRCAAKLTDINHYCQPVSLLERQPPGGHGVSVNARTILMARIARGSRKEVFQPHLPVRLPCYDLAPITSFTLGRDDRSLQAPPAFMA